MRRYFYGVQLHGNVPFLDAIKIAEVCRPNSPTIPILPPIPFYACAVCISMAFILHRERLVILY